MAPASNGPHPASVAPVPYTEGIVSPGPVVTPLPLSSIIQLYIDRLRSRGRSERTLDSVPPLLNAFARFHAGPLATVTAEVVERFLTCHRSRSGKPLANRTRNNYLATLKSLVSFAKRHRYVPPWFDELDRLERWTVTPRPPGIYTPAQMRQILDSAAQSVLPGIVAVAFCGLRVAEVRRIQWLSVDFERNLIFIDAAAAKMRQRRICPILPNAREWLIRCQQHESRPLYAGTRKSFNEVMRRSILRACVRPVPNGFRHSFCSYRLAAIKDAGRVAVEAGNSPDMLGRHYVEVVTESAAAEWFGLVPNHRQLQFRF